tara:strand:- start:217 stop:483 length:267 start_codon:yes stop_codon:yes gene_type:complete
MPNLNTETAIYGEIPEENKVVESIKAREIVQEILTFGVNQHEMLKIIYFLSLELEDRKILEQLSDILRPLLFEEKEKDCENSNSIIME